MATDLNYGGSIVDPTAVLSPTTLPAPGSAGPGSYAPPKGFIYDPTTGQFAIDPNYQLMPGATYDPSTGRISAAPGTTLSGGLYPGLPGGLMPKSAPASTTPPPSDGSTTPTYGPGTNWGDPATIAAYLKSIGSTDDPAQWAQYWSAWGSADPSYFWQRLSGLSGGAGGSFAVDPSYLAPFTQPFAAPAAATIPAFQAPGSFQQPTAADVQADPSYQFRRDQAVDVLQKTKAAQGLYNSGGTVYDLGNLASNFASQEYNNVWARDYGLWNQNWQNALAAFGANQNTSNEAYNRAWQQYQNARDTFYANQTNPFTKLATAAQLGAGTAQVAG